VLAAGSQKLWQEMKKEEKTRAETHIHVTLSKGLAKNNRFSRIITNHFQDAYF
jgi:hypothetical protein